VPHDRPSIGRFTPGACRTRASATRRLALLSLLVLTNSLACGATAAPRPPAPAPASVYRITDITVIDVERGVAVPRQTVIVEGDRITRIGASARQTAPGRARRIDGRGLFLMPGLVDAHIHYLDPPVFGRLMIANGVLLVRDMGMPNDYILKLRDGLNRGEGLGPEMVATGTVLDGDPPLVPSISQGIKTPEEGRDAVRKQAAAGVDMIKVYSRLDPDVFRAIVEEAQKHGLKAVGHVPETVDLEDAARAGLASSEHFFGFDRVIAGLLGAPATRRYAGMGAGADYFQRLGEVDTVGLQRVYRRIRATGMAVCPTVVVFKRATDMKAVQRDSFPRREYVSPAVFDIWKSQWSQQDDLPEFIWRNWARMVGGLSRAGVPLMVGTDLLFPGVFPGYAVHEEMAIWQDAGIAPPEILRSATLVPAKFMGLGARLGSVSEGMTASMVLVRANPLEDVRNAGQIEGVFKRGQYFDRGDLDRLLEEAKALAGHLTP